MSKRHISIRMDDDNKEKFKTLCKNNNTDMSKCVNEYVDKSLRQKTVYPNMKRMKTKRNQYKSSFNSF